MMSMQPSIKNLVTLFITLSFLSIYGQKENKMFSSKEEYLEMLSTKYGIKPEEVYYASTDSDKYFERLSSVIFIKNNKIATTEEVSNAFESSCSIQRLYDKVDESFVDRVMTPSPNLPYILLKNLKDGTAFHFDNSKYVVFHFTYRFGNANKKFINTRKMVESRMGHKPVIVITDGAYIMGVEDLDRTEIEMK